MLVVHKHFAKRFWSRVQTGRRDQCWPWTGKTGTDGYGQYDGIGWAVKQRGLNCETSGTYGRTSRKRR
jgi:hypothetical protein